LVCHKSNKIGATSVEGIAYLSGASEFTSFKWVSRISMNRGPFEATIDVKYLMKRRNWQGR
jgi:hypothetical protein